MRASRHRLPAAIALAAGASTLAVSPSLVAQEIQCRGEEPFWGLAGTRTSAVYSTPGPKGRREVVFRGALYTVGGATAPTLVWRGESTHLPKDTLVLNLREEACKSTMADGSVFTHRAVLSLRGGEALAGCCTLRLTAVPAAKPAP